MVVLTRSKSKFSIFGLEFSQYLVLNFVLFTMFVLMMVIIVFIVTIVLSIKLTRTLVVCLSLLT